MSRLLFAGILTLYSLAALSLHAQRPAGSTVYWKGSSGAYNVDWSATNLKVTPKESGAPVFDASAKAKAAWNEMVRISNGTPMEADFTFRLLSIVGPYLSVEESTYCDCGGAHPTASVRFRAYDLSHGTPAELTSLFPESALLSALSSDPIVSKALHGKPKPASLPALLQTLRDENAEVKECQYEFPEELLSSFALYDLKDGNASVRLGLPAAVQTCRGNLIQLGLSLPVPAARRTLFSAAKEKTAGLLLINTAHGENAPATSFHYKQRAAKR